MNQSPPPLRPIIPPDVLPVQSITPPVLPPSINTTNQWQEVQSRNRPSQPSTKTHLKTNNRFEVLADITSHPRSTGETIKCDFCQQFVKDSEDLEMHLVSGCKSLENIQLQKPLKQTQHMNAKRPSIVVSENYVKAPEGGMPLFLRFFSF